MTSEQDQFMCLGLEVSVNASCILITEECKRKYRNAVYIQLKGTHYNLNLQKWAKPIRGRSRNRLKSLLFQTNVKNKNFSSMFMLQNKKHKSLREHVFWSVFNTYPA